MPTYTAVDLGATSGRVVNVLIDARPHRRSTPVRRFPNSGRRRPRRGPDVGLRGALRARSRQASARPPAHRPVASVGVDCWAVDYGLLDARGDLVGPVHAYRSPRTDGVMDAVGRPDRRGHLYGITGIQFLPFNTIYQLVAARETDRRTPTRALAADGARPDQPPTLRQHDERRHQRQHDAAARRATARVERRAAWPTCGLRRDLLPAAARARHARSARSRADVSVAARRRRASSPSRATTPRAPSPARRWRPRGRASTSPAARGRWSAASWPAPVTTRRRAGRERHQRARRRRHDAAAQERDRAVAARGVPARVAGAGASPSETAEPRRRGRATSRAAAP